MERAAIPTEARARTHVGRSNQRPLRATKDCEPRPPHPPLAIAHHAIRAAAGALCALSRALCEGVLWIYRPVKGPPVCPFALLSCLPLAHAHPRHVLVRTEPRSFAPLPESAAPAARPDLPLVPSSRLRCSSFSSYREGLDLSLSAFSTNASPRRRRPPAHHERHFSSPTLRQVDRPRPGHHSSRLDQRSVSLSLVGANVSARTKELPLTSRLVPQTSSGAARRTSRKRPRPTARVFSHSPRCVSPSAQRDQAVCVRTP